MPRSTPRVAAHRRHKKILLAARGMFGRRRTVFRLAKEAVDHARQYAYAHRKDRKGQFRRLWIVRINAAARLEGMTYSQLLHGLSQAGVELDRKILAHLAVSDAETFRQVAGLARKG